MENSLAQKAINLALSGDWKDALALNQKILTFTPNDVDALNRIARCFYELGNSEEAIKTTEKVLKIDPDNSIALKCLVKWKSTKSSTPFVSDSNISELFLEESGKTKLVTLLNPGSPSVLLTLYPGQEVKLSAFAHKVSVSDLSGVYLGRLPDDLAARVKNLLKNGCKYLGIIKSVDSKHVSVFLREVENNSSLTSFPPEKIDYVSFTPPELVHKDIPDPAIHEEVME